MPPTGAPYNGSCGGPGRAGFRLASLAAASRCYTRYRNRARPKSGSAWAHTRLSFTAVLCGHSWARLGDLVKSRVVTAFLVFLAAGCRSEASTTICWLGSERPVLAQSTGSDDLDREEWVSFRRRGFFYCAEDTAYQVIQLGGDGEFAKVAALKDCSDHWLREYRSASSSYHRYREPSATDEALQKLTDEDVQKLLDDFSTQIEVFKLCYAKGIKSPSWN